MSDYKVTLPDGTEVEGPDWYTVGRLAQAFDDRRIAEENGIEFGYLSLIGDESLDDATLYSKLDELSKQPE